MYRPASGAALARYSAISSSSSFGVFSIVGLLGSRWLWPHEVGDRPPMLANLPPAGGSRRGGRGAEGPRSGTAGRRQRDAATVTGDGPALATAAAAATCAALLPLSAMPWAPT